MKICFLDIEANGLPENEKALPLEVAVVTVDFKHRRVVRAFSETLNFFASESFTNEVGEDTFKVHGMSTAFVHEHGLREQSDFILRLRNAMLDCDGVFARNGLAYDKIMLARIFRSGPMPDVTWIDDYFDVDYPEWVKGRSLSYIAADHGFLNPFAHSALGDTLTLAYLMLKGQYDMEKALASAKTPLVLTIADVSFDKKDLAKKAGFQWNGLRKRWFKINREPKSKLMTDLAFRITQEPISNDTMAKWQNEARS